MKDYLTRLVDRAMPSELGTQRGAAFFQEGTKESFEDPFETTVYDSPSLQSISNPWVQGTGHEPIAFSRPHVSTPEYNESMFGESSTSVTRTELRVMQDMSKQMPAMMSLPPNPDSSKVESETLAQPNLQTPVFPKTEQGDLEGVREAVRTSEPKQVSPSEKTETILHRVDTFIETVMKREAYKVDPMERGARDPQVPETSTEASLLKPPGPSREENRFVKAQPQRQEQQESVDPPEFVIGSIRVDVHPPPPPQQVAETRPRTIIVRQPAAGTGGRVTSRYFGLRQL